MKIKSLANQTNLIFPAFLGKVTDRGNYIVVDTETNPGYYWGNCLIFDRPPKKGDIKEWVSLFKKEFPRYDKPQHYAFSWEPENDSNGDYSEFLNERYEVQKSIVLSSEKLVSPPRPNVKIKIRKIIKELEWHEVVNLHDLVTEEKYRVEGHRKYLFDKYQNYKKMSEAGHGHLYGAFIDDQLVSNLGIFHSENIGRYQNVATHPDYQKQGIAGTLVYEAGRIAFNEYHIDTLVMMAELDSRASGIYNSVGFKEVEKLDSLLWFHHAE